MPRNSFLLVARASTILLLLGNSIDADEITIQSSEDSKPRVMKGTVLDFRGTALTLRMADGRQRTIPSTQVRHVEAKWTEEQIAGDRLLDEYRFNEALSAYASAWRLENRNWVKQRILANTVWCYRGLGQVGKATETFSRIVRADPQTPYIASIPLSWQPFQPSAALESRMAVTLQREPIPILQLVAASWLLSGRHGLAARAVVERLLDQGDKHVALLAAAILWRTESVTATLDEVRGWSQYLSKIPRSLRAGPYFLVGQGLARHRQHEAAVAAYMRLPILYPREYQLASHALLEAGRSLSQLQRFDNSARLYRELLERFPQSSAAMLAKQELEQLAPRKNGS